MLDPDEARLLRELGGAMVAANSSGIIEYATAEAGAVLGRDAKALPGKPLVTLMPKRIVPQHQAGFDRYRRTGRSRLLGRIVSVPALTDDGEERQVDLSIRIFKRPDGSDLLVGTFAPAGARRGVSTVALESEMKRRAYALV